MAKISELTGEAREQRIAELKKKMQESAIVVKAAHAAGEGQTRSSAPAAVAEMEAVEETPVATAVAQSASEAIASENGAAVAKPAPAAPSAPKATPKPKPVDEVQVPVLTPQEMNRREFLTYSWAAALGVLGLETGVASFQFLYPRFRAGEFGGEFNLPLSEDSRLQMLHQFPKPPASSGWLRPKTVHPKRFTWFVPT